MTSCAGTRRCGEAYAALKDSLAVQHRTDRDAYTDAKGDFIRSVLHAAGVDATSRKPVG